MVPLKLVQSVPRFAGISPVVQAWLAERVSEVKVAKGSFLFLEGESCSHFHLIEEGTVKVFKTLESGRELILDVFGAGEAVGEVALIDGAAFPASASALEDVRLLKLPRADYFNFISRFPEAPLAMIRDLSLRMRSLSRRVQELGGGGVDRRLAQILLTFGKRVGETRPGGLWIPSQLSRQELAAMVGARIETVIRTLSRWHKSGLVLKEDEGFLIPSPSKLEKETAAVDS